jgi:hypothetical protein
MEGYLYLLRICSRNFRYCGALINLLKRNISTKERYIQLLSWVNLTRWNTNNQTKYQLNYTNPWMEKSQDWFQKKWKTGFIYSVNYINFKEALCSDYGESKELQKSRTIIKLHNLQVHENESIDIFIERFKILQLITLVTLVMFIILYQFKVN